LSNHGPFREYANFYEWFHSMGCVAVNFDLGYGRVNNYSNNKEIIKNYYDLEKRKLSKKHPNYKILIENIEKELSKAYSSILKSNIIINRMVKFYILTYTQEEAGFESKVNEMVLYVDMKPQTYKLINKLKNDLFIKSEKTGKTITADTSVKLQQKMHQLFSGTIKLDDGSSTTIDDTKARYILEMFKDKKIAIFYNFVQELQMLKDVIGTRLTTSLEEFNATDKWYAGQIVSSREGISLAKADCLVMLNIQFSAVSYWQSRDRLTTKERKENDVFWIMANKGIEANIYKKVMAKTDYTNSHFKKDFDVKIKEVKNNRLNYI
jgi:hypothetical protein